MENFEESFLWESREFRGPILSKTSAIYFLPGRMCPILNMNIIRTHKNGSLVMENTLHIVATHLQSSQFVTFLHCCIVFTVESFHLRKKSSDQNVSENFPVSSTSTSTSTSTTMTIDHQPPCRKLKRFSALGGKSKPKNS